MSNNLNSGWDKMIPVAQWGSLTIIWVFVISLAVWIANLILLSIELNDAPGASIGISLVAIPVFFTLACILTYVFIGLKRGKENA